GAEQPLGVARADGDVAEPDPLERGEGRARGEWAGVVRGDDALAGDDAGRGVAARRAGHPGVGVLGCQRDVARRAGRAAGRVDPDDLAGRHAEVAADRVLRRARRPELALLGEREAGDARQAAAGVRAAQLLPVEGGTLEQVAELVAVGGVVRGELLGPGPRLDL